MTNSNELPARPTPLQGDLRNLPLALTPLKALPNWVNWSFEWRVNKKGVGVWTKPPFCPSDSARHAQNNKPETWGSFAQALMMFVANRHQGIGFALLNVDYAAFDLDKCRDKVSGVVAPEAMAIVERAKSYCEITPSGTGLRVIGLATGAKIHRKQKIKGSTVEVESYRKADRYITVSGNPLPGWNVPLADIDAVIDAVVTELDVDAAREKKPRAKAPRDAAQPDGGEDDVGGLPDDLVKLIDDGPGDDADLSEQFHHVVCWMGDLGWTAKQIEERIAGRPIVPERYRTRLMGEVLRCLGKARGVNVDDFYAYMPKHLYIFAPTGEMWPKESVNARLPASPLVKKDGSPALDARGKQRYRKANAWLDKTRPVEQMSWAPGEPQLIKDRLIDEGGWIERAGVSTFNLYRPPIERPGKPANAERWVRLVQRIYPDDCKRIITFFAHRIQKPAEKINHSLLIGGFPGTGKDTLLEPLKHGVGPWNFKEVSPQDIMGSFNEYRRSVVLRISEARDLGDVNRYAFHDHMKTLTATPPDTMRVNPKFIPPYYVLNVTGVIYTTNHRFDALYLPPNDRRTDVMWSEALPSEFADGFWREFYAWYRAGGLDDVVAYLREFDLSAFDPKAPPPKTPAFWQIVGAGAAPEERELADALDALGQPVVTTLDRVVGKAEHELARWLRDHKNRRTIPHRLENCGYIPVRNDGAKDGQWVIGGKRQAVYGRMGVARGEVLKAIRELMAEIEKEQADAKNGFAQIMQ